MIIVSEYFIIAVVLASVVLLAWALLRIKRYVDKRKELMLNKWLMIVHSSMLVLIVFVDVVLYTLYVTAASNDNYALIGIINLLFFITNITIQFIVIGIFLNISNSFKPTDTSSSDEEIGDKPLIYDFPRFNGEKGEALVMKKIKQKDDLKSSNSSKSDSSSTS
jgi:hypothetical protein